MIFRQLFDPVSSTYTYLLADEASRVPGRARCQLVLFEEDDIGLMVAGQMIGGRAADDTAADHHDLGAIRNSLCHSFPYLNSYPASMFSNRSRYSSA